MPAPFKPITELTDPKQKEVVREALLLRGTIVTCYAHAEFLLADICMKCWPKPEYQHLRGAFPYSVEKRIKAAGALFKCSGPLQQYQSEVEGLFEQLLRYEELRHFTAHGLSIVTPSPTNPKVQYQLWRPTKLGADIGIINTDLEQLRHATQEIALYTNTLIKIFHRVYLEQVLD